MNEKEKINADVKYEPLDVNAKWLGVIGAFIVIAAIVLPFILWGLYGYFEQTAANGAPIPESESRQKFNQPRPPKLEPNAIADYKKYRAEENEKLNNYGWVDKEKGVVRIPIEQTMKILAAKGLPKINAANNAENANVSNAHLTNQNINASVSNQSNANSPNENGGLKK